MSTRQYLPSALRQCRSALSQQPVKHITTTTAQAIGLRQISRQPPSTDPSKQLSQLGANDIRPNPNDLLRGMLTESSQRAAANGGGGIRTTADAIADLRAQATTDQFTKMMPRRWAAGTVYAPRDLGVGEQRKWAFQNPKGYRPTSRDDIDKLGINPLDNYRNFNLISEYMTPYGRIKNCDFTGLRPVNQRKMAKTIRRAIGLGIHPSVHYHPELIKMKARGRDLPQVSGAKTRESKSSD